MSVPPTGPARVDPAAVRPGRWLYLLAAVVAVVSIGVSVVAFVVSATREPELHELGVGVQTRTLRAEEPQWLYVSQPERIVPPPCQLLGAGDVTIEPLARLVSVEYNGATWYALARISVSADGQYGLACTGAPGGIRLAIGSEPRGPGLLGSVVLKFVVPIVGLVVALVLFLVTLVRRRSHRATLAAGGGGSWTPPLPGQGYAQPPPPGYYGAQPGYAPPDQYGPGQYGPQDPFGQQGEPPTQHWRG